MKQLLFSISECFLRHLPHLRLPKKLDSKLNPTFRVATAGGLLQQFPLEGRFNYGTVERPCNNLSRTNKVSQQNKQDVLTQVFS